MSDFDVVELPVHGEYDAERARRADVLVHNGKGSEPPLYFVRTWSRNGRYVRDFAAHLGPDQPIYSLAPPFFEERGHYPETVTQWAEFMLERVRALPGDGSFRIGGYSFGGLVALEMAELLAAQGAHVPVVLIFDTWVPPIRKRRSRERPERLIRFAKALKRYGEIPSRRERRAHLVQLLNPWSRAPRRSRKHRQGVAKFLGTDEVPPGQIMKDAKGVEISFLKRAVQVAFVKYHRRPTELPLAVIRTRGSAERKKQDASLGWSQYARGEFRTFLADGTHFEMFDAPYLPRLAAQTTRILRDVRHGSDPQTP